MVAVLGGSWVVIRGVMSPNMGYNYSYPASDPTYNYP